MCGIAGVVRRDGAPIPDRASLATTLAHALAHRGPDGRGVWHSQDGDALLVHTRLAIIDLTPAGAQPMTADGRHTIVFNGEIYNYRELRSWLERDGERFRTSNDTEVLLRLLATRGPEALSLVRGMFAFACWDHERRALLLARDRFGIKPLYVVTASDSLAFSSELAALRVAGLVDERPSPAAVLAFLSWGSVPPPLAWNRGAEMLEPGTWLERHRDGHESRGRFADARDAYRAAETPTRSAHDFRAGVAHAVRESVRAHLVADVPVGVFLSGGIDSGALVSAAASCGARALQTFTVAFDDVTSEASRARLVADRFGTTHRELRVEAPHVAADLPHILARLDQPSIDAVNSYYVSRAVAATGIKAVVSGAGGDELFGGYPSFSRVPPAVRLKRLTRPFWPAIACVGRIVMPSRLQDRWRYFADSSPTMLEGYRVQRGFLLPSEIAAIAGPALTDPNTWAEATGALQRTEHARLESAGVERPLASIARLESRLYLQSQLLRDLDAMSMAHGLEVRVPFVDHELVAAVWPELAEHPTLVRRKRLLQAALDRPLPPAITSHPKQGFTLPFARWMRGELAPIVDEGLTRAARAGWVGDDVPERLTRDWRAGRVHWSRPWGVSILGRFAPSA